MSVAGLWRNPQLLLLAVVFGGFALRMPNATSQLEYDEVITLLFGTHSPADIVRATAADTMPPLHYWLMHLFNPTGELFSGRFLSTLLSTLTLPAFYALARRLAGSAEAVAATGLLAVSPIAVFYGHYARMYSSLALFGVLAAYFYVRWLQRDGRRNLVLFTGMAALSLWVHNLAGLLVLALDIAFLLGRGFWPGSFRRRLVALAVAHGALLVAYGPWLLYLPQQLEKVNRAFWIGTPGAAELARTVLAWHFHLPLPAPWLPAFAFVALAAAAVTALDSVRRWRSGGDLDRQRLLLIATLTLAPVAIMFIVSQVRPVYVERSLLVSAGAYGLLVVGALARLPLRPVAL
ncbi:MAG: glycosyltransferase family 39 protein, partial [Aquabacterium sp.]